MMIYQFCDKELWMQRRYLLVVLCVQGVFVKYQTSFNQEIMIHDLLQSDQMEW